jgi:uncharacterized protein (TIGR03437 family)
VRGLPENADCANVRVMFGDVPLRVTYARGAQINAEIPKDAAGTREELTVAVGNVVSQPAALKIS